MKVFISEYLNEVARIESFYVTKLKEISDEFESLKA